jgi:CheY-like chemotaxis protein
MKRLLIIDDDKAVGNAIKTWLEVEGAEVTHLEDGGSGIEAIESGRFDLVIVDLLMPGLDGLETIEILHRIKPDLPIIVMSALTYPLDGSSLPDVMQRATELGVVSALCKPFRPSDLMRAIETSLGGPLQPDTLGTEPGR